MARFFKKTRRINKNSNKKNNAKLPKFFENDEIKSSDDDVQREVDQTNTSEQYKRKVKAREELSNLKTKESSKQVVHEKLLSSVMSNFSKSRQFMANKINPKDPSSTKLSSCFSVNCLALLPCGEFAVLGTRSCSLIKWNIQSKIPVRVLRRRNCEFLKSEILCVASFETHVAIGARNGTLMLLDLNLKLLKQFPHKHKGAVTGVRFGHFGSFYTCSEDKTVKCWNLSGMVYSSTLYGHQNGITDMDIFRSAEKVITSGGREATVRIWKIMEDKHVVFSTTACEYVDCVAVLDDEHFVSAGNRNSLQLWKLAAARPIFYLNHAHGGDEADGEWISAVEAIKNSDLFVSGGCDGFVRFWKLADDVTSFSPLSSVWIGRGFVNGIVFSPSFDRVIVISAKEHRLGSWWKY